MKKILLFVLCCIMAISLIGCDMQNGGTFENESKTENNAAENNTTVDNDATNNETTKEETENNVVENNTDVNDDTTNGETTKKEPSISLDFGGDSFTSNYTEYEYLTFDMACDTVATDVVVATFEGWKMFGPDHCEYVFSVKDRIFGNAPERISVYVADGTVNVGHPLVESYIPQELFLKNDKDYLLVLDHEISVYNEVDVYLLVRNIIIDVEKVSNSKMYGQSIIPHSPNFDFSTADLDSTIEYIKELVKDNYSPTSLEANPDINTVVSSSEDVVVVEVGECVNTWITGFRKVGYYLCTVTETLKGDASTEETVIITFNLDDVETGETAIVALDYFMRHYDYDWYQLSSKNSVISIDEKEQVIAAIEAE